MVEFPTITSITGLLVLMAVGTLVMWLKESGAREERERQEQLRKYEKYRERLQHERELTRRESEERRADILAQKPKYLRKLYNWQELAEMNDLNTPEDFVNFHAEIGQIKEGDKSEMLKEVQKVWNKFMTLPRL